MDMDGDGLGEGWASTQGGGTRGVIVTRSTYHWTLPVVSQCVDDYMCVAAVECRFSLLHDAQQAAPCASGHRASINACINAQSMAMHNGTLMGKARFR